MKKYLELNTCFDCKYHSRYQSEKDWCNCLGSEIDIVRGVGFDKECPLPTITQQRLSDIKMSDIRKRCMKLQKHKE